MFEVTLEVIGILTPLSGYTSPLLYSYHWAGFAMLFHFCFILGYRTEVRERDSRFLLFLLPFLYIWVPLFSEGSVNPLHMANIIWFSMLLAVFAFTKCYVSIAGNSLKHRDLPDILPGIGIFIMVVSASVISILSGYGLYAPEIIIPPLFFIAASLRGFKLSYLFIFYLLTLYFSLASPLIISFGLLSIFAAKISEMFGKII